MSNTDPLTSPKPFSRERTIPQEDLARRVAGDTLTDLRTVRRELSHPGSVRGLTGDRIRCAAVRLAGPTGNRSNSLVPEARCIGPGHDILGTMSTSLHASPAVDDALVDRIAQEADADHRSVVRRLAGLPVRGRSGRRIDAAIARLTGLSAGNRAA